MLPWNSNSTKLTFLALFMKDDEPSSTMSFSVKEEMNAPVWNSKQTKP
jgi:hypothetical protein